MIHKRIAIIGIGHIGRALVNGLLEKKVVDGKNLILASPHLRKLQDLQKRFSFGSTTNNIEAVKSADIVMITVRPKIVDDVVKEIVHSIKKNALIISTAACVSLELLAKYFSNNNLKMVRIMPNIPIAYGMGVVGWIGNRQVNNADKKLLRNLLSPLGLLIECKNEKQLDKLSLISGCGPGYVGYFIHNLERLAKKYGFTDQEARNIVLSTFTGTLQHLITTGRSAEELVEAVATKGGITEEIVRSLTTKEFYKILSISIKKGYDKIGKIKRELEYGHL